MDVSREWMTAKEAAAALGISLATLYAYTSRGQLRSEPLPGRTKERRYFRTDVERLLERKEARRDPARAAAKGLHWGSPVLSSGITLIENGRLYYRGHDVVSLARTATLEDVAVLLWGADEFERDRWPRHSAVLSRLDATAGSGARVHPLVKLQMALPLAGAMDPASYDLRPQAVRQTGARILQMLASIVTGREWHGPVHLALQAAWASNDAAAAEAIRCALVLCADHELNVSAFTARCVASAGASPYEAVAAAIAAVKGSRHGGETERVAALMFEAQLPGKARSALASRLRRGERLPGFGHPLYPGGDPRAAVLMKLAKSGGNREQWALARVLASAGRDLLQEMPNVDFALTAMSRTHGFPDEAPLILFALGRTVGWIGHALEQYSTGELIRPRARYVGPPPAGDSR